MCVCVCIDKAATKIQSVYRGKYTVLGETKKKIRLRKFFLVQFEREIFYIGEKLCKFRMDFSKKIILPAFLFH